MNHLVRFTAPRQLAVTVEGEVGGGAGSPPATSSTSALIQRGPSYPAQGTRLVSATEGQGRWPLNWGLLGVSDLPHWEKSGRWAICGCPPFLEAPLPALQALGTGLYHISRTREGQKRRRLYQTAGVAEVPGAGAAPARRDLALDLG